MFECDVKLSSDDVPFLLHDSTLERTPAATHGGHTTLERVGATRRRQLALERLRGRTAAHAGGHRPFLPGQRTLPQHRNQATREASATPARCGTPRVPLWRRATVPRCSLVPARGAAGARDAAPELPRGLLLESLWTGWLETASHWAAWPWCASTRCGCIERHAAKRRLRTLSYTVMTKFQPAPDRAGH